jgi:hypothetical protein
MFEFKENFNRIIALSIVWIAVIISAFNLVKNEFFDLMPVLVGGWIITLLILSKKRVNK